MFARKPDSHRAASRLRPEAASLTLVVRTFLFGVLAIAGAAWALVRHHGLTPPPMLVPVPPRTAPTYDADAGEIPVPDEWLDPAPKTH
jgi:hypothetical protein